MSQKCAHYGESPGGAWTVFLGRDHELSRHKRNAWGLKRCSGCGKKRRE